MARARNIKPGFFTNEELVELPFHTRLLFIGLWTLCDRAGRMEDRPKRIKMGLFPADDIDVDQSLNELQGAGFLVRYEHEGSQYIQVLAFDKHQNPHRDERHSIIPAPCGHSASTVQGECENGGNRADSPKPDSLIPETPNNTNVAQSAPDAGDVEAVFEFWKQAMKTPRALLDDKRKRLIRTALKTGYTVDQLTEAITGCANSEWHMGKNDRGTKYNGLDLILRNAEKIDSFIELCRAPASAKPPRVYSDISKMNYQDGVDEHGNF